MLKFERRGRSEEKRSSWQPYRVALSDDANSHVDGDADADADADADDDEDAVYGKQVKFTFANSKNKDNNKWGNRRTGESLVFILDSFYSTKDLPPGFKRSFTSLVTKCFIMNFKPRIENWTRALVLLTSLPATGSH